MDSKILTLEYGTANESLEQLVTCTVRDNDGGYLAMGIGSSGAAATVDALRSLADRLDVK